MFDLVAVLLSWGRESVCCMVWEQEASNQTDDNSPNLQSDSYYYFQNENSKIFKMRMLNFSK